MRNTIAAWLFTGMLGLLAVPAVSAAQGNDELWEVTISTEMPGMPMAMPAITEQACTPKGSEDPTMGKNSENCKLSDVRKSGNKMSYTVKCTGKTEMTGKGEFEKTADRYRGTVHMVMNNGGQKTEMTQKISGKRIGSCSAAEHGKQVAAKRDATRNAMVGGVCKDFAEQFQWKPFTEPMCASHKRELCARVNSLRQPLMFNLTAVSPGVEWEKAAEVCGESPDQIRTAACKGAADQQDWTFVERHCAGAGDPKLKAAMCKSAEGKKAWKFVVKNCDKDSKALVTACNDAKGKRDWKFVASYCEKDVAVLGKEHCAGRSYTAMSRTEYGPLCDAYAAGELQAGKVPDDERSSETRPSKVKSSGSKAESLRDEGVKRLKKLLPF